MLLAALDSVSATSLKDWLIIAGGVMGLALLARQFLVRTPPLEKEFVSREEFTEFETRISGDIGHLREKIESGDDRIVAKITETKEELNIMGSRRSKTLFDHIDKRTEEIFRRLNEQDKHIARLDERSERSERSERNHGRQ